jgi:hypothetical protein
MRYGLVNGFTGHSRLVSARNNNSSRTSSVTYLVFWICNVQSSAPVTASNCGRFRTVPVTEPRQFSVNCSSISLCHSRIRPQWTQNITTNWIEVQSWSYFTTDGHSASLSWYQATIRTRRPLFLSPPWELHSDTSGFLFVGRPPWREGGSVTCPYKCCWVLPALSLSGPSPAGLMTISYCLVWD